MSSWGTGIKQSDEFCDVYDEFFERYVGDFDPLDIAESIWQEYYAEFGDGALSPMLYTVRYALAQSLWECGVKDEKLWGEIDDIIRSGRDLQFWAELEADGRTLKSRKKQLELFWERINSVPKRIKKPKKPTEPRKPTLAKGDIFAYSIGESRYRACVVFDFIWNSFLIAVTDDAFSSVPTKEQIWDGKTSLVFWCPVRAAVPKKDRIVIEKVQIDGDYNGRAGLIYKEGCEYGCISIGERIWFYEPEKAAVSMKRNRIGTYTMRDLLEPKILPWFYEGSPVWR